MKRLFLVASAGAFVATLVLPLSAQQVTPATVKQALAFAEAAKTAATPTDAVRTFNQQMEATFGSTTPLALHQTSSLLVALVTPMTTLRTEIAEHLRKLEPVPANIATLAGVGIIVEPKRIDAPDITTVVVLRDRQRVSPIVSTLAATALRTAAGLTVMKHAGSLIFPEAAFAPGAAVHVTLIPDTGDNIELDVPPANLAMIFATRDQLSRSLLKLSESEVEKRIGKPTSIAGHRWTYATTAGTLQIYFGDDGTANDVQPASFPLAVFEK